MPAQPLVDRRAALLGGGAVRQHGDRLADQGLAGRAAVSEALLARRAVGAGVQADPIVAGQVGALAVLRQALDEQPADRVGDQRAAALLAQPELEPVGQRGAGVLVPGPGTDAAQLGPNSGRDPAPGPGSVQALPQALNRGQHRNEILRRGDHLPPTASPGRLRLLLVVVIEGAGVGLVPAQRATLALVNGPLAIDRAADGGARVLLAHAHALRPTVPNHDDGSAGKATIHSQITHYISHRRVRGVKGGRIVQV